MNMNSFPIFKGMSKKELAEIKIYGKSHQMFYDKGSIIYHIGDKVQDFGIVLKGSINIESIDLCGNRTILNHITTGGIFGENYALCCIPLHVNVVATHPSEILFINLHEFMTKKNAEKLCYKKILKNLLMIIASKNFNLSNRIFCTSPKTVRARVMTYLCSESVKYKTLEFSIPFNRQEMADYLNLDRSALSKELGKMRDEGIISFHKNHFKLHFAKN